MEEDVNIEVNDNHLVISPAEDVKRKGWADAFKMMAKNGDDNYSFRIFLRTKT